MAELNAEVFKANYPEIYQEIFDKGFSAGRADAIADAVLEKRTEQKQGLSGVSADQSENKKILESMVPRS